jgi:hypothetical protein
MVRCMSSPRAVGAIVFVCLTLAACGGGSGTDDAAITAAPPPASTTTAPSEDTVPTPEDTASSATEPPTTEPVATEPPTTEPAATEPPPIESTTTAPPADIAEAVTRRLSSEFGDASLAGELVTRFGPDTLQAMEGTIGIDGADDSLLLAASAPTVDADDVDSLVVYAFGNRVAADGALSPGPVNEEMAALVTAFVTERPVPVYAQWEVADLLLADGVPGVISIGREIDADGNVTYLSTAGVADKAVALAAEGGTDLGRVGVIGFADHAVRCVLTSRAAGMTADVPAGVALPAEYDAESGQPWTRNRLDYLSVDIPSRLAVWPAD